MPAVAAHRWGICRLPLDCAVISIETNLLAPQNVEELRVAARVARRPVAIENEETFA
jgi:hypothetical protein